MILIYFCSRNSLQVKNYGGYGMQVFRSIKWDIPNNTRSDKYYGVWQIVFWRSHPKKCISFFDKCQILSRLLHPQIAKRTLAERRETLPKGIEVCEGLIELQKIVFWRACHFASVSDTTNKELALWQSGRCYGYRFWYLQAHFCPLGGRGEKGRKSVLLIPWVARI